MSSREIETAIEEIRGHVVDLVTTLDQQMETSCLHDALEDGGTLQSENLGQLPERCVEDALIWPTLETLGFEFTPRPYYPVGDDDERPDFRVDNLADVVIGENKSLNGFSDAKDDIEEYLDSQRYEYGIATDGLRWGMYEIETDSRGTAELDDVVVEQDLTPVVQRVARERGLVSYTEQLQPESDIDGLLGGFYQSFNHYGIRRAIGGLDEFYDFYLETLAGDGEYQSLDSNLVSAIDAPEGAASSDKLAFAALFVDRMAFLKLLVDRGILEDISLQDAWSDHNQGLNRFRGSFYSNHLQPLFYDVLSTPPRQRSEELAKSFPDVPHLAGGLFEQVLPDEAAYDIPDETMKVVLARFVEAEGRTLINEAASGSLLQTYTEEYESRTLAGEMPRQYSAIVEAYATEIDHVESHIERTLRSFETEG